MRSTLLSVLVLACSPAFLRADPVDYQRQIKPVLKERCYACHGALKQKGRLRLDTVSLLKKGGASGTAAGNLLIERVTDHDESTRMPPEGQPLTADQIALLKQWIAEGATGPAEEAPEADPRTHWAFQPPRRAEPPAAGEAESANPIDRFLAAERTRRGQSPGELADRATLLRRVYLDLIGLPPTRQELREFLRDESETAYEKVVDRLLASPLHGERWARHWMDIWRYSDWYGRRSVPDVLNSYGQIWRWRDWIVQSLNRDRGYDEMLRLMLAADELSPASREDTVATGFLVRNFFRWNYNNWMRDNVEHTAKAFLGLTLNCCHCHDHKYDPISQEEYFRFRAIFEPLEIRHDRWPGEPDPGPYPKYSYGASYMPISSGMVRVMDEKLDVATRFYTGGDERNVAKDRPPIPPGTPAILGGRFDVQPVSLPTDSWYPGSQDFVRQEELARLDRAIDSTRYALAASLFDSQKTTLVRAHLRGVLAEQDALRARIAADDIVHLGKPGDAEAATRQAVQAEAFHRLVIAERNVENQRAAVRNAQRDKNEAAQKTAAKALEDALARLDAACRDLESPPATYSALSPQYPRTSTGRRAALARWITARDNPLTARVAVNHLWNWHFGEPLVETTNNFGRQGKPPSHPELLDWLAIELMDAEWKLKPLHRLIVTSRAYRESSRSPEPGRSRFLTTRMQAEVIRDSMLHLAGELDPSPGGPEVPQDQVLASRRRSLYIAHHGEVIAEFFALFDGANPCDAYRRLTSVMPQQALALENSELAIRLSRVLAGRFPAGPDGEFVESAFEHVLARSPRAAEREASLQFLERQRTLFRVELSGVDPDRRARENLILALFNHTDFVTVR